MKTENLNYAQFVEKLKLAVDNDRALAQTTDLYHGFLDAYKIRKNGREDATAEAFGMLSMKVKEFLVKSTDLTLEEIDRRIFIL